MSNKQVEDKKTVTPKKTETKKAKEARLLCAFEKKLETVLRRNEEGTLANSSRSHYLYWRCFGYRCDYHRSDMDR